MMMADKTKLSPTARAAVFQLGHEAISRIWRLIAFSRSAGVQIAGKLTSKSIYLTI